MNSSPFRLATLCTGLFILSQLRSLADLAPPPKPAQADEAPIASVTTGKLRGFTDQGILVFKGIPYGEDSSKRRFQAPLPAQAWKGVRDALAIGPMAPQVIGRRGGLTPATGPAISEDCLRLNVWTPALRDTGKRPVLVYFHGGAYNNGSVNEDLYDGVRLCKRGDVVLVTVNHRLNGFGFLLPRGAGWDEVCGLGQRRYAGPRAGPALGARQYHRVRR